MSPSASPARSRRGLGTPERLASPERDEGSANAKTTTRPPYARKLSKQYSRSQSLDVLCELEKRKTGKETINLVVIGHVDAGKSTLMGHLLYLLGNVNQRAMHKYETESRKAGKSSFAYAWVLDETGEERSRGITMDVAVTKFETNTKIVTLLDAPGHRDFIPHMITGAAQADVAVLVVDAARGEFESGFDAGGQTREHAMLVRSLGVKQLAVAVNKMDTVDWEEERFRDIVKKLVVFLKQAGFKETDIRFVPCSGLGGENLTSQSKIGKLVDWYTGPCLIDVIDEFKPPERLIKKPFRCSVTDIYKGLGSGFTISGKIISGYVQISDRLLVMPTGVLGQIKAVSIHDEVQQWAAAGDHVALTLTDIEVTDVNVGSVLSDSSFPIKTSSKFKTQIIVFNIDIPITRGFPVLIHYQSVNEPGTIRKLVHTLNRNSGEVVKKNPRCLVKNSSAVVVIETSRPICVELYKDFKDLGRFMLRSRGATIAAGVIIDIIT